MILLCALYAFSLLKTLRSGIEFAIYPDHQITFMSPWYFFRFKVRSAPKLLDLMFAILFLATGIIIEDFVSTLPRLFMIMVSIHSLCWRIAPFQKTWRALAAVMILMFPVFLFIYLTRFDKDPLAFWTLLLWLGPVALVFAHSHEWYLDEAWFEPSIRKFS